VTLNELSHTFPADIDMLLVGPQGQTVILMSDAGGGFDMNVVTLRLDDTATEFLPAAAPIVPGPYKPTNIGLSDTFAAPAPAGPYGGALSVFNGQSANGDWLLYIMDDQGTDSGMIAGGWRLNVLTAPGVLLRAERSGSDIVLSWPASDTGYALESGPTVAGAWTLVTASPPVVNGRFTVSVPAATGTRFFRLRKP
jgi:hypothetical protein